MHDSRTSSSGKRAAREAASRPGPPRSAWSKYPTAIAFMIAPIRSGAMPPIIPARVASARGDPGKVGVVHVLAPADGDHRGGAGRPLVEQAMQRGVVGARGEEERAGERLAGGDPVEQAIEVHPGGAARVGRAEAGGGRATERHPVEADALGVESPGEEGVGAIVRRAHGGEAIEDKARVLGPAHDRGLERVARWRNLAHLGGDRRRVAPRAASGRSLRSSGARRRCRRADRRGVAR